MLAISTVRADFPLTLEDLVRRWRSFVADLNRGCSFSEQDFERALSYRALLDELDECLSPNGRKILQAAVLEADRAFIALTAPVNCHLWRPWWQRVPHD
jgi:hypothetical protein